eukprot:m.486417 g.486417  ORF g.486417 m.486417 type:complete len:444 (+) comp24399_c0_seq1:578-1909(+)
MGDKQPLIPASQRPYWETTSDSFGAASPPTYAPAPHKQMPPSAAFASPTTSYGSTYAAPALQPVEKPTFKGEVPEVDMDESARTTAPEPSAPPLDIFTKFQGYEHVSLAPTPFAPPPVAVSAATASSRPPMPPVQALSQEVTRKALLEEVGQHCCWGRAPAEDSVFSEIKASHAFHYQLETFTERRVTELAFEPYYGQPIDGPDNGTAPGPWDIVATPHVNYKPSSQTFQVPHTAVVKPCYHCIGLCQVRCHVCCGRGRLRCSQCRGQGFKHVKDKQGHSHRETCSRCFGMGRRRCSTCIGHGQVNCPVCSARGQLKTYIKLTVTWYNHVNDHMVEKTELPDQLALDASGTLLYEEEGSRLHPVSNFPEDSVNTGSHGLISRHSQAWSDERILCQRHRIRSIPVYEAHMMHRDKRHRFWVYGLDQKVHAPDYPAKLCWGCSVM